MPRALQQGDLRLRRRQAAGYLAVRRLAAHRHQVRLRSRTRSGRCPDGTAYGTYMGGPVAPGPAPTPTVRLRLGTDTARFPGEIVHFDKDGKVLSEGPAASAESEDTAPMPQLPGDPGQATCANPHGIQVRTDLKRMVVSDYAERATSCSIRVSRRTTSSSAAPSRLDISKENDRRWCRCQRLPNGPRNERNPVTKNRPDHGDHVTNAPNHKGAFRRVDVWWRHTTHPTSPTRSRCGVGLRRHTRQSKSTPM